MKRKPKAKRPTAHQRAADEARWASPDMQNLSKLATGLLAVPKAEVGALPDEGAKRRLKGSGSNWSWSSTSSGECQQVGVRT